MDPTFGDTCLLAPQRRDRRIHPLRVGALNIRAAVWPGREGAVPLLLFNGIGGNMELLEPFVEALGATVEVIMFDVPGTGRSDTPSYPYSMRSLVRLSERVLDKLGYGRVDVMGVSWGGALAQQFAHSASHRCRRLVLCATMAGAPLAWPASPQVLMNMLTPKRFLDRSFMQRMAGTLYGGRFRRDPALVQEFMRRIRGPRRAGYLLQLTAVWGWTSAAWIWRLRQPTLVIGGADDPLSPPINSRILAAVIPNARLEILDEGHLFIVAEPALSARIVRRFLEGQASDVRAGPSHGCGDPSQYAVA